MEDGMIGSIEIGDWGGQPQFRRLEHRCCAPGASLVPSDLTNSFDMFGSAKRRFSGAMSVSILSENGEQVCGLF